MAKNSDVLFGVELLVGAGRDIAHGHEGAGFDTGGRVFPRLADIDEAGLVFAEKGSRVGRGYLKFEHESSLVGRRESLKSGEEISLEEMPPILNAQSITKQFGANPLLKDISFHSGGSGTDRIDRAERRGEVDAAGDPGGGG